MRRWCCWRAYADAARGACVRVADDGNATGTRVGFGGMIAGMADGADDDAEEDAEDPAATVPTVPVTDVDADGEEDEAAAGMTEELMAATTASPGVSILFLTARSTAVGRTLGPCIPGGGGRKGGRPGGRPGPRRIGPSPPPGPTSPAACDPGGGGRLRR